MGGYFTSLKPENPIWFGFWVWSNPTQTDLRTPLKKTSAKIAFCSSTTATIIAELFQRKVGYTGFHQNKILRIPIIVEGKYNHKIVRFRIKIGILTTMMLFIIKLHKILIRDIKQLWAETKFHLMHIFLF